MLIGLTGYAQHGKDTVAAVLVEEFGFTRFAFADTLKSMALTLNPWVVTGEFPGDVNDAFSKETGLGVVPNDMLMRLATLVEARGWEAAKQYDEVRRFLQVLGTEGVRGHLGEHAWVDALIRKVDPYLYDTVGHGDVFGGDVVISDVRFGNEADFIHEENGQLWRIERENQDGTPFDNGLGTAHPSEAQILSLSSERVVTAYSVEQLQSLVRGAMRQERAGWIAV